MNAVSSSSVAAVSETAFIRPYPPSSVFAAPETERAATALVSQSSQSIFPVLSRFTRKYRPSSSMRRSLSRRSLSVNRSSSASPRFSLPPISPVGLVPSMVSAWILPERAISTSPGRGWEIPRIKSRATSPEVRRTGVKAARYFRKYSMRRGVVRMEKYAPPESFCLTPTRENWVPPTSADREGSCSGIVPTGEASGTSRAILRMTCTSPKGLSRRITVPPEAFRSRMENSEATKPSSLSPEGNSSEKEKRPPPR